MRSFVKCEGSYKCKVSLPPCQPGSLNVPLQSVRWKVWVEVSPAALREVVAACPQHLLVVQLRGSNPPNLLPAQLQNSQSCFILTPFALIVFVRIVDLENRKETLTQVHLMPHYRLAAGKKNYLPSFPSLCHKTGPSLYKNPFNNHLLLTTP